MTEGIFSSHMRHRERAPQRPVSQVATKYPPNDPDGPPRMRHPLVRGALPARGNPRTPHWGVPPRADTVRTAAVWRADRRTAGGRGAGQPVIELGTGLGAAPPYRRSRLAESSQAVHTCLRSK